MNIRKRLPYLAVLLIVPLMMAPANDIPEKLTVGAPSWDQGTQSVVVPLAVQQRFLQRGDYFILTYVVIVDELAEPVADFLSDPHVIVARRRTSRNEDGLIEIAPQFIFWDRNAETFTGPACVLVMSQIFTRDGKPVNKAGAESMAILDIR